MTKHTEALVHGSPLPEWVLDELLEYISAMSANLRVTKATADPATALKIEAGPDNDQVSIGINGRMRHIATTISSNAASGLTGSASAPETHGIYVAAEENAFPALPQGSDPTDYGFKLMLLASGATPSGAVGSDEELFRHIGTFTWDGTKITRIDQEVGAVPPLPPLAHGPSHSVLGTDPSPVVGPETLAPGVIQDVDFPLTVQSAGQVLIGSGKAWVDATLIATIGTVVRLVRAASTTLGSIPAAAAGQARIDIVQFRPTTPVTGVVEIKTGAAAAQAGVTLDNRSGAQALEPGAILLYDLRVTDVGVTLAESRNKRQWATGKRRFGGLVGVTQFEITGLDGDADKSYDLDIVGFFDPSSAERLITVRPNGITSPFDAVFTSKGENGDGSLTWNVAKYNPGVGFLVGKGSSDHVGALSVYSRIRAKTGHSRIAQSAAMHARDTTARFKGFDTASHWIDTVTPIRSLMIHFGGGVFTGDIGLTRDVIGYL